MAAIYLHIPFCSKACHYCNFHFSTSLHRKAGMVDSMEKEILQFPSGILQTYERRAETLYFGGGTPSLLSFDELLRLKIAVQATFDRAVNAEITLEANPDDITAEKLEQWVKLGINRLSIGVQSFFDEHLQWMNRAHEARQAINAIKMAQEAGITNISIDLIYGLPGLSIEKWKQNLDTAAGLGITHLSGYALTVEPQTALDHFIRKGKVAAPDESLQADQFQVLQQWANDQGWEAYEISNYAKPGYRSQHNSSYWKGKPYYGFGPSAHSFDGKLTRWWNVANNALYQTGIDNGHAIRETEQLTTEQRINELIMTSIRTMEGLSIDLNHHLVAGYQLPDNDWQQFQKTYTLHMEAGHLRLADRSLQLTESGKFLADGIASDLFV